MRSIAKFSLSLAGLLVALGTPKAWAKEEIDGPAGELPDTAELPDVAEIPPDAAPEDEAADVDAERDEALKAAKIKKTPKAKIKATPKKPGETEPEQKSADNWDSYSEAGTGGVAQEITKGIRVEDIVEPPSDYRYAAFGKADPFVPPMVTSDKPLGPGNLEIPIVSPLQRFDVAALQLVGVWQLASGERKAMILTPGATDSGSGAGQGIIVKNGDPIGTRGGKILGIGDDFLTVREFTLAIDGTRQYEDQQMYMGTRSPDEKPGKIVFKPGEDKTEVIIDGQTPGAPAEGDGQNKAAGEGGAAPQAGAPAAPGKAGVGNGDKGGAPAPGNAAAPAQGGPLPKPGEAEAPAKPSAYKPLQAAAAPAAPAIPAVPAAIPQGATASPLTNTPPPGAKTY